ncbi:MAG: tyrosine-type recombinase/integrase [Terriglobales bacterium]
MGYSRFTRQVSANTLRGYQNAFDLLLKRYPGITTAMLSPELLSGFFEWLQTRERIVGRGAIRQGVKKTTIATYWVKLTKFFSWLVLKGYVTANPLKDKALEFPRIRYDDRKYLEQKDMKKILLAVSGTVYWQNDLIRTRNIAIIAVALYCGLRRTELLSLKVGDVDLAHSRLIVQAETSKSQMSRTIPLNSEVRRSLTNYLDERSRFPILFTTPFLWVAGHQNTPLKSEGLRYLIKVLCRESQVKFHLHQLRHTFAVNFLHNSGHSSFKLQGLLGHRSIVSTAAYTRCLPPEIVRADLERMADVDNMV